MHNNVTLGQIVHFMDSDGHTWPAMVVAIHRDTLNGTNETVVDIQYFTNIPSDHPKGANNLLMATGPREAQPGQWWPANRI